MHAETLVLELGFSTRGRNVCLSCAASAQDLPGRAHIFAVRAAVADVWQTSCLFGRSPAALFARQRTCTVWVDAGATKSPAGSKRAILQHHHADFVNLYGSLRNGLVGRGKAFWPAARYGALLALLAVKHSCDSSTKDVFGTFCKCMQ
jgi:hypothetical protein